LSRNVDVQQFDAIRRGSPYWNGPLTIQQNELVAEIDSHPRLTFLRRVQN
jgi:hypothetical protein